MKKYSVAELTSILENHLRRVQGGGGGERANLSEANMGEAYLSEAYLSEAVGNMGEIKSAQFDTWRVTWTAYTLAIGCQQHNIPEWFGFDDAMIDTMDSKALGWWNKYKEIIRQLIEVSR